MMLSTALHGVIGNAFFLDAKQKTESCEWIKVITLFASNYSNQFYARQFLKIQYVFHSCRFRIILGDFLFIIKMVYCVYTLESPR